ncbi:MAG: hypothetical protein ACYS3S_02100 [Planctomycetota bacterium]|jgi:hypothetical protein
MYKENTGISKACFLMIMTSALLIMPADAVFALDIYMIIIWDTEYREDGLPLESFEFSVGVIGDDITQVTITPPGGTPIALNSSPTDPLFWGFSDEEYDTFTALRIAYPTGDYVFTFNGGEDSVTVNHNPTVPTGFANITYPPNNAINVLLNPVFTWDSAIEYGDALHMAVAEEDMEGLLDMVFLADVANTSWAVGPLNPGVLHWLEVSVLAGTGSQPYILQTDNTDPFEYYDLFENCNIVFFTTVNPVVEDDLDIDWIGMTSSMTHSDGVADALPWKLEIWVYLVDTGTLDHIDITAPGDEEPFVTLTEDGPIRWGDFNSDPHPTLASLRSEFPEGVYIFEFYNSSGILLKTIELDYSDFPSGPTGPVSIIYPPHLATGISTTPTITWAPPPGDVGALIMSLEDEVTDVDIYEQVISSDYGTSWTPGPLQPDNQYDLAISACAVKNWSGAEWPTDTVGDDTFSYLLMIEHLNETSFATQSSDDPIEEIEEILDFVDESVEDGTLTGNGPGNSAGNRLNALRNMIENAAALIEDGFYEEACDQLWSAYRKCDGKLRPPDFVAGEAAEDLADMILLMMDELGC